MTTTQQRYKVALDDFKSRLERYGLTCDQKEVDDRMWICHAMKSSTIDTIIEALTAMAADVPTKWKFCPECGCTEYKRAEWNNENWCNKCGQTWFPDIDYTSVVKSHLRTNKAMLSAAPQVNAEGVDLSTLLHDFCEGYVGGGTRGVLSRPETRKRILDGINHIAQHYNITRKVQS